MIILKNRIIVLKLFLKSYCTHFDNYFIYNLSTLYIQSNNIRMLFMLLRFFLD